MIEYAVYDERTREAVLALARARFAPSAEHDIDRLLANPLRAERPAAGDVVLVDGRAVCFQALIARQVHLGQEVLRGHAGGSFVKAEKGCPAEALLGVVNLEQSNAGLSDLAMGNTCISRVAALSKALGKKAGPDSWKTVRFAVLRPFLLAALIFWRKVLKREQPAVAPLGPTKPGRRYAQKGGLVVRRDAVLDKSALDAFWRRYLSTNRGLVLSRTSAELDWLFGEGVAAGTTAFLSLRRGESVEGYVVVRRMRTSPRRWQVVDLITLDDDVGRLDLLLWGAKRFLRREAGAIMLEATGFPDRVQPLLRQAFPFERKLAHNPFVWRAPRPETSSRIIAALQAQEGWFFGPYDGDYCV